MTHSLSNPTFRASVNPRFLEKASRYFSSSVKDILIELLQNARRAKATEIRIALQTESKVIMVSDNGVGISDPKVVLDFGNSQWEDERIERREDPAGAGIFSLGTCPKVQILSQDWQISLVPEHFIGAREVQVTPATPRLGTAILFQYEESQVVSKQQIPLIIQEVCRYFPVPTYLTVDGTSVPLTQEDFLQAHHCQFIREWRGLRIGVTHRRAYDFTLNFYGLVISANLPEVNSLTGGDRLYALIDVQDCEELRLVLPSRKEVVNDDFWNELKTECKRTIFLSLQAAGRHSLPYTMWLEARAFGVDLPEATVRLRSVQTTTSYSGYDSRFCLDNQGNDINPEDYVEPKNAVIADLRPEDIEERAMIRAWYSLFNGDRKTDRVLVRPNWKLQGYSWYDALPRLSTTSDLLVLINGSWMDYSNAIAMQKKIVDRMVLEMILSTGDRESCYRLPLDLWVRGNTNDFGAVTLSKEFGLDNPDDWKDTAVRVFDATAYEYESDYDEDGDKIDYNGLSDEIHHAVKRILLGSQQVLKDSLQSQANDLVWALDANQEVTIVLTSWNNTRKATVELRSLEASEEPSVD